MLIYHTIDTNERIASAGPFPPLFKKKTDHGVRVRACACMEVKVRTKGSTGLELFELKSELELLVRVVRHGHCLLLEPLRLEEARDVVVPVRTNHIINSH